MDFAAANAAIAAAERLDIPTLELMVRVEASGEAFYAALADRVGNTEAAELLRRNGREEMGHARRLQRVIAIRTGVPVDPEAEIERFPVEGIPETVDPAILPLIVQGELDGDAGYQRWADEEEDPEVARLLRMNGREESTHAARIDQVIALLADAG